VSVVVITVSSLPIRDNYPRLTFLWMAREPQLRQGQQAKSATSFVCAATPPTSTRWETPVSISSEKVEFGVQSPP
jgi:hypothetical protein